MPKIAIVVIAYNRANSFARLLDSINQAYIDVSTTLILSIDKSKTNSVVDYAKKFEWRYGEKRVIAHSSNLGLKRHILGCGKYLEEFDAIILLEDDLVVSKNFYQFAKQAVSRYSNSTDIAGVSLYSFPTNYQTFYHFIPSPSGNDVYFMKCAQSWGQVWMREQWRDFFHWYELNKDTPFDKEKLPHSICSWSDKSWLKFHTRYCIESGKYFVYPYQTLTSNCGECGEHLDFSTPVFQNVLASYDENYVFRLIDFSNCLIKYDGYFEFEPLYDILGLDESQLCLDLTKSKQSRTEKRYLLTTESLPYKVVNSYGLSFLPIEQNIVQSCLGRMIFLYDTTVSSVKPKFNRRQIFAYYNRVDIIAVIKRLLKYGPINILKLIISKL